MVDSQLLDFESAVVAVDVLSDQVTVLVHVVDCRRVVGG